MLLLLDMVDFFFLLDFPMANIWKSSQLHNLNAKTTVLGGALEEIHQ